MTTNNGHAERLLKAHADPKVVDLANEESYRAYDAAVINGKGNPDLAAKRAYDRVILESAK